MASPRLPETVVAHYSERCLVAPSPEVRQQLLARYNQIQRVLSESPENDLLQSVLRPLEKRRKGFNDGVVRPPSSFQPGVSLSEQLASRAPLRGAVRVIVVLVEFTDTRFTATQTKEHFSKLWFKEKSNSVRDYYQDVSNGAVTIQGEVVGPYRLPHPITFYANNANGLGDGTPNAQLMARDAARLANPDVTFSNYDNDKDGYVDAFVVVHAGQGAERTGKRTDIWSHKWFIANGPYDADGTKIYAYLTVPGDCKLGVCAHELGHLAFGWPDLYDADYSSEGIGVWCLMAAGSYNGNEENPSVPCAWCKVNQGWVDVDTPRNSTQVQLGDVKDRHRVVKLWKDGTPQAEYFLVENRQKKGRDADLPAGGLLIWHIDETEDNNNNETQGYKVALLQSDGARDLEDDEDRGDAGDPFPGTKGVRLVNSTSNPSTKANNGAATGVNITQISDPSDVMSFTVSFGDVNQASHLAGGRAPLAASNISSFSVSL